MKQTFTNIKSLDRITQLIIVLSVLYIVTLIVPKLMLGGLALQADSAQLLYKPWTIASYSFIHANFLHFFSNILVLYYLGNLFLDFFCEKKFWIYYLSGAVVGGVFFLGFKYFNSGTKDPVLLGASASVTALLIGLTAKVPHYGLYFRFIGRIELWVLSSIWILLSIVGLFGIQAGATMAHLGGGFIGYLLTILWKSEVKTKKIKSKLKTIYRNPNAPITKMSAAHQKRNNQQIDAILDKISQSGYDSLSQEEKQFLLFQKNNAHHK